MNILGRITSPLFELPFFSPKSPKTEETPSRKPARVKRSQIRTPIESAPRKSYRATSVVFEDDACDAVKAIGGRRFLKSERNAPILPLPECGSPRCGCKYVHYEDRRDDDHDRRLVAALQTQLYESGGETERRKHKRGRRKTDL